MYNFPLHFKQPLVRTMTIGEITPIALLKLQAVY